jgi:hypothetical protein
MPHVIEPAASGRATCRGCGRRIAAAEWRFGERLPNPFAEGEAEMTRWFHLWCAAFRRPAPLLDTLPEAPADLPDRDRLDREARLGVDHRRVPRVGAASRAPSGRATCRACRDLIEKGVWRIALVFDQEGRFVPSGFIHAPCAAGYFETAAILPRVRHFSPDLADEEADEIGRLIGA